MALFLAKQFPGTNIGDIIVSEKAFFGNPPGEYICISKGANTMVCKPYKEVDRYNGKF